MLFEFPPTTLLIYRQPELNVLSLQYWILISFFALFYFFPPFILRLSLYCTNHSNYTCNLSSAYIKSSQVALQTLMLNSSSELCSKEGSFLTRSVQFPAVCLFPSCVQHVADLRKIIIHVTLVIRFAYYDCFVGDVGTLQIIVLFKL